MCNNENCLGCLYSSILKKYFFFTFQIPLDFFLELGKYLQADVKRAYKN